MTYSHSTNSANRKAKYGGWTTKDDEHRPSANVEVVGIIRGVDESVEHYDYAKHRELQDADTQTECPRLPFCVCSCTKGGEGDHDKRRHLYSMVSPGMLRQQRSLACSSCRDVPSMLIYTQEQRQTV